MIKSYKSTVFSSYLGYVTQAIGINLAPLLFATFSDLYSISLNKLTLIITATFFIQLFIDLSGDPLIKKFGFKFLAVASHIFCAVGLIMLSLLPQILPPYTGIIISILFLSIGAGLTEVVISPLVNLLPSDNKESQMSMLHSFYSWGHIGVVLISTFILSFLPRKLWFIIPLVWSVIPAYNAIAFSICPVIEQEDSSTSYKGILKGKFFILFILMMICGGGVEQVIAQWGSYFAEVSLGLNKVVGDIIGVCGYALLMAISRTFYGFKGKNINLSKYLAISSVVIFAGLVITGISNNPIISIPGICISGLGVGILWPGTLSLCNEFNPNGNSAMFSLLAFGGDVGCILVPTMVGFIANYTSLNIGILSSALLALIYVFIAFFIYNKKKTSNKA